MSTLFAWVHQLGVSPPVARMYKLGTNANNPLAVQEHQGDTNDAMNPNGGHQIDIDHSTGRWNSTQLITRLTMITHWMHNSQQLPTT